MINDVRYALRHLAKQPLFLIMATLTLALGIGATTAVFSGIYALLLKPLPYHDPDKLVVVTETLSKQAGSVVWSPLFSAWRDENHVLDGLTAWSSNQFSFTGAGEPERLEGASVAANFFSLLGCQVKIGRDFLPEEMQNSGSPVAILSDALWHSHFGADPRAVGPLNQSSTLPPTPSSEYCRTISTFRTTLSPRYLFPSESRLNPALLLWKPSAASSQTLTLVRSSARASRRDSPVGE